MATFPFEAYEKMRAEEFASVQPTQKDDDMHAIDEPGKSDPVTPPAEPQVEGEPQVNEPSEPQE